MISHPMKKFLIVRAVEKKEKNAVQWAKISGNGMVIPRTVSGTAFLCTIYNVLGWNTDYKYRVRGVKKPIVDEDILFFDLSEVEMLVPRNSLATSEKEGEETDELKTVAPITANVGKSIVAIPSEWADNFGTEFYKHTQNTEKSEQWYIKENATPFSEFQDLDITSRSTVATNIQKIINDVKTEDTDNE